MDRSELEVVLRRERAQTIRCFLFWAIIVGIAWLVSAVVSYAKQEQTKPEMRQFDTQKTVSVGSAVPSCLRHLSPGDRPQFVFRSADGTVIVVGSEDVRKRC